MTDRPLPQLSRITEGDGTDTEHLVYDDRWRLISRHDGSNYTEEVVHHAAGLDGFGGASDVDSVIMRRTFLTTGSPQTEDNRSYILQNWRQDPAVTVTDAGVQVERAHFSPYGRVLGMPAGDTDFDFAFDSADQTTLSGWSGAYQAHADVDLDGDVDSDDATANTTVTMGWDVLSSVGSNVGYAGYVQDAYVPTVSHVRYRVLKVDLGRWLQRDPAGYVDGANLYEYTMSSPVRMVDRMGLSGSLQDPCANCDRCFDEFLDCLDAAKATHQRCRQDAAEDMAICTGGCLLIAIGSSLTGPIGSIIGVITSTACIAACSHKFHRDIDRCNDELFDDQMQCYILYKLCCPCAAQD